MKIKDLIKELENRDGEELVYFEYGSSAAPVTRVSGIKGIGVLMIYDGPTEEDEE